MNEAEWKSLKYFKKEEFGINADKMSPVLLHKLDSFRDLIRSPLVITSAYRSDSERSQHYYGRAVDIIAPDWKLHLLDLYFAAEKIGFTGIGLYSDWKYEGIKLGGLHLDIRLTASTTGESRWIGRRIDGKNKYYALSYRNLVDLEFFK